MKKSKIKGNLIKIMIALLCLITLSFAMPKKNEAWIIKDYIKKTGANIAKSALESLAGVVDDFVNLLLAIPDGIVGLLDYFVCGTDQPYKYDISSGGSANLGGDKAADRIYSFEITPYNIFVTGSYEQDPTNPDRYITKIGFFDVNFFSRYTVISENPKATVSSTVLTPTVSKVYENIRNLCIIVMMLVLLYIGIKILLSSIAEQQAKYKQMLIDWLVAFSLLFIMHYIMSFIVNINSVIIDMLRNDEGDSYYIMADTTNNGLKRYNAGRNVAVREGGEPFEVDQSRLSLVYHLDECDDVQDMLGNDIDGSKWGIDGEVLIDAVISGGAAKDDEYENVEGKYMYKLNTLSYIRTVAYQTLRDRQIVLFSGGNIRTAGTLDELGYTILYVVLVIEVIMFAVIYIKRVIQIAFLTMIAPLVALMYPIDKIGDGKAQAFNTWFKDYLFGILIQPLHLLLYTVFIRAAGSLLQKNIIYALAVYAYMIPAEKYFKKILGFEKGGTGVGMGGPLAGALGAGLAMGGLNKLTGIGPGGKGGSGKEKRDPRKHKIPKSKFPTTSGGPGAPSSSGGLTGGTPSSSGRRGLLRRGGTGSGVPGAAGASGSGRNRSILGSMLRAPGRSISRAVTGGKYESLFGTPGAGKAAARNIVGGVGGKVFRGATRTAGAVGGAIPGMILGTASAMVTGNPMDAIRGTIIGAGAGNKFAGSAARGITNTAGGFFDDIKYDYASGNEAYANKLRVENAFEQFSPELADLSSADRAKYSEVLREMSPYTNFSSFDEVKAMYQAAKANGGRYDNDTLDAFKAATNWGDLRVKTNQDSFIQYASNEIRKDLNINSIPDPNNAAIQEVFNKKLDQYEKESKEAKRKIENEYRQQIHYAKSRAEENRLIAERDAAINRVDAGRPQLNAENRAKIVEALKNELYEQKVLEKATEKWEKAVKSQSELNKS